MSKTFKQCAIEGCANNAHRDAHGKCGYCNIHYRRIQRHGDANVVMKQASPAKDWLVANKDYQGDECLKWPFAIGKDGYGRAHRFDSGKLSTASRIMCELAHGAPPSQLHECAHRCGNGHLGCTNPNHLYWATSKQNKLDKLIHGTDSRGERSPVARLTADDVLLIRELLKTETHASIAKMFNVSRRAITDINTGRRWAYKT